MPTLYVMNTYNVHREFFFNVHHQELPIHLLAINDLERLQTFLTNWSVFDELYREGYSSTLLKYWRQVKHCSHYYVIHTM